MTKIAAIYLWVSTRYRWWMSRACVGTAVLVCIHRDGPHPGLMLVLGLVLGEIPWHLAVDEGRAIAKCWRELYFVEKRTCETALKLLELNQAGHTEEAAALVAECVEPNANDSIVITRGAS